MARIPIIPRTWKESLVDLWNSVVNRSSVILGLWRLLLVVLLVLLLVAMAANPPGAIAGFVIFTILGIIFRDEIRGTVSDLWNLDFWGIEI